MERPLHGRRRRPQRAAGDRRRDRADQRRPARGDRQVRRWFFRAGLAALLGAPACAVWWSRPQPLPDTDPLAVTDLAPPDGPAKGIVFLFSGEAGYGAAD